MIELKEKKAVVDLFNIYSNDIMRYALSIVHNIEEAEDIVQDVFLKYQLYEKSFNNECNYKTWLFTITRNICYNKLKEAHNKTRNFDEIEINHSYNVNYEEMLSLKKAMSTLSADENELIFLRDYEKYSYKELANILDLSIDNIKVKLFRVKKKLKKILEEQ